MRYVVEEIPADSRVHAALSQELAASRSYLPLTYYEVIDTVPTRRAVATALFVDAHRIAGAMNKSYSPQQNVLEEARAVG